MDLANYRGLTTEVIQQDVFVFNTKIFQHTDHGCVHHRWTTHVVFTIFRRFMVLQIVFVQYVVDEASVTVQLSSG